jgi:hypothetical protein
MQEDKTRSLLLSEQWTWVHAWFSQSSLSIYFDDHFIDGKSIYNCHALMITLWRLYVLEHIVERSNHMCLLVSPSCEASMVFSLHHVILLSFYPQIKDAFYTICVTQCICHLSLRHPLPTYIILLLENIS